MAPAAVQSFFEANSGKTDLSKNHVSPSHRDHEEYQYLDLIRDILDCGEHRPDRTGTGTYSLFAPRQLRFSLSRPSTNLKDPILVLPLLTTKRVFLRAVIVELLWFISADTSIRSLNEQNVHIWDGNGSREYLDGVGLSHREEGDLGPVYGFQWRHFGADYVDAHADYRGQGADQLAEVVRKLKEDPFDRRIILSAWNPSDLKKMALPPCHMFAQFYVSFPSKTRRRVPKGGRASSNGANDGSLEQNIAETSFDGDLELTKATERGVLHTILYQRSCDMGLGVPFNIASYALLTHMLAHVCDLVPGSLTHTMGDAHVYLDHVEALEGQITREPRDFPTLEIKRDRGGNVEALEGWTPGDFEVKNYHPHKAVAMKMSI